MMYKNEQEPMVAWKNTLKKKNLKYSNNIGKRVSCKIAGASLNRYMIDELGSKALP